MTTTTPGMTTADLVNMDASLSRIIGFERKLAANPMFDDAQKQHIAVMFSSALAQLTLALEQSDARYKMAIRLFNSGAAGKANLFEQLHARGLTLDANGNIIDIASK